MQLSLNLFQEVVQGLEQHEEAIRIKKLIFCLCKKYWENDPNILNSFTLEDLLKELIQAKPTIEQLTFSMYKLVKTLNRPKVYASVAKIILARVNLLYDQLHSHSEVLSVEPIEDSVSATETQVVDEETLIIEQVAASLNHHQEQSRIKKLIYCICQNRWENNLQLIDQYGMKNLVIDICQIYPTKNDLKIALKRIVENLNKQSLYIAIANVILNQLDVLYKNLQEDVSIDREEGSTQIYSTQIIQLNRDNIPQRYEEVESHVFETSVVDLNAEQGVTELKQIEPPRSPSIPSAPPPPSPTPYDLFELRSDIMQYTNPLRAKILLFSILFHPWDRSGQDWSMLRSYTIDDLLEQLIQGSRPLAEIEKKLYTVAKSIGDTDLNLQSASTIIETVRPFL